MSGGQRRSDFDRSMRMLKSGILMIFKSDALMILKTFTKRSSGLFKFPQMNSSIIIHCWKRGVTIKSLSYPIQITRPDGENVLMSLLLNDRGIGKGTKSPGHQIPALQAGDTYSHTHLPNIASESLAGFENQRLVGRQSELEMSMCHTPFWTLNSLNWSSKTSHPKWTELPFIGLQFCYRDVFVPED
ncbi:hypothetical protein K435DRAFT_801241 [Dendrothele bispora CBS 962.96]|uniref:Uncharacterized protein n=1 Tax=Dendrothele bispora (strain CBS 962.96) TaxID=1314807 RepID=A0A4S8LQC8_DENBC|nr:hypothetical protein K435DRAFT_801241 [Dendrothele bispora CBS 962.96]